MDLSLSVDNIRLNIRASVILETPRGIFFEYDRHGFYYPVGGRLKIGEESAEAAVRELYEELRLETDRSQLSFCGIYGGFLLLRFRALS